jgi:hypothetical protein
MRAKAATKKKANKTRAESRSKGVIKARRVVVASPEEVSRAIREVNKEFCKDGDDFGPYPIRRNPEPPREETAKKLAARKALTIRAFKMAYENHHRRRAS